MLNPRALLTKRRLLAAGVTVVILGAGGVAWAMSRTSGSAAASTTTLVAANTQTLRQVVSATGTIKPASEADLSFSVSGTVTSVPAIVGGTVAKGAALATIDPTDLQAAVDSAQASVAAATEQVTASATSTAAQQAAANAQLASAQAKLTAAQQALAAARLTSPIAGTVAAVNISTGDRVGSGSSNGSGSNANSTGGTGSAATSQSTSSSSGSSSSAQVVVISTSSWVVSASVGSADLAQIKRGLQVEITPTGTSTKVFGLVTSVGIVATSSGGSATFPVGIAITGTPTGLYAGGTADVSIIVRQMQDALTVPTAAVHTVNGKTVVYQQRNGKQVDTAVTLGAVYGPSTQILSGLQPGDQVVVQSFRQAGTGGTGNRQRTGTGGGTGGAGFGGGGFGGGGGGFGGTGGGGTGNGGGAGGN